MAQAHARFGVSISGSSQWTKERPRYEIVVPTDPDTPQPKLGPYAMDPYAPALSAYATMTDPGPENAVVTTTVTFIRAAGGDGEFVDFSGDVFVFGSVGNPEYELASSSATLADGSAQGRAPLGEETSYFDADEFQSGKFVAEGDTTVSITGVSITGTLAVFAKTFYPEE